jgi:starch-binding outer membrane protein, SusD/RagB family
MDIWTYCKLLILKKIYMKKILFFLTLFLVATSCDKFYEEDLSTLITSESGALNNVTGLTAALAGAYRPLSGGFAGAATPACLMGSDDLTTNKASNKADFREFDQFVVSNTNQRLAQPWNGCYKAIQQANNIIANYGKASGSQATLNQIAGEAYFIRAWSYFWIVRMHGKAPIVLNSQKYDDASLKISASSVEDIYAQIIADLKLAETLVQNKKPAPGRVGLGTIKHMLAKVYLQMTGYPLNDVSKYALAASYAKNVIDNQATYGFGLMDDFNSLWPTATMNNDGNKEEVFTFTFQGTGSARNSNALYGISPRPPEAGGWDDFMSELTFFNEFPAGYRKNCTFQTSWTNASGVVIPYTLFQTKRPYYRKMQGDKLSYQTQFSIPMERFAETLMIFAEAQVMSTGNASDPLALEAFNKIKRRGAGLPPNTPNASVDATSLTQKQIITEKGWEFAGEFIRWFDLVRLQLVQETVDKKDPDELKPLGPIKYFAPMPNVETDVNPNLLN